MNEKKARSILSDFIQSDGSLFSITRYTSWKRKDKTIVLDDEYTVDELEAIVWWIKNNKD